MQAIKMTEVITLQLLNSITHTQHVTHLTQAWRKNIVDIIVKQAASLHIGYILGSLTA